jgi:hypothetical protein
MDQFCHATDAALANLKRRATGRCLQFHEQELPPGANPQWARIGIEVDPRDGAATLLVEKGIAYHGDQPMVRKWLKEGCLRFENFEEMCRWIREELAVLYRPLPPRLNHSPDPASGAPLHQAAGLPLVGCDEMVRQIELCLAHELQPTAVVLAGRSGVGKTAICNEVAGRWQMSSTSHVVSRVELAGLLAGTACSAERQRRLQQVLEQALPLRPNVLLVLEDLHLACAGDTVVQFAPFDSGRPKRQPDDPLASLLLQSAIDAGLHVLATTTPRGLSLLRGAALRRRIEIIEVPEPSPMVMLTAILPAVAGNLEKRLGVQIAPESLGMTLRQSECLFGAQPAKAIRLLERAAIKAKSRALPVLGPDDVLG